MVGRDKASQCDMAVSETEIGGPAHFEAGAKRMSARTRFQPPVAAKPVFKSKQRRTGWNNQSRRSLNGTCWRSSTEETRTAVARQSTNCGIRMASLSIRAAFMKASKRLTPLPSSFSLSLKAMCSHPGGQDNLYMASVAFLGPMDRPMTHRG